MTSTVLQKKSTKAEPISVDHESNGRLLTPREFDRADFEEGWRYELINAVVVVSPIPSLGEMDPNEELGFWLRLYQHQHPKGSSLNLPVQERTVRTGRNRRRVDRCIWANLGRLPTEHDRPTIAIEFVSARKRDRQRDYEAKRDEYMKIKIKEYWVIDRFERCLTVFTTKGGKIRKQVFKETDKYTTPLLPGFELPLAELFAIADKWASGEAKAG